MIVPSAPNYRLKRGTKYNTTSDSFDSLPPLSAIDGPFQLAEYLSLKVRADPHDVKGLVEVPAEGRSTDRDVWIYEHLRRLPIDLTPLISQLLTHCNRETCPEMKAEEWQYLCVAHGSGVSEDCCAIDYILHTLDSATAVLNSSKNFPSRMQIPPGSLSHFPSLSRRLSRIFSHAHFHHREQFLLSESETSLYARFVALCEKYALVGKELLIIPHSAFSNEPEAEEEEEDELDDDDHSEEEEGEGREAGEGDTEGEGRRRRDKEGGGGKRTLSLDRQSGVGVKLLSRETEKGKEDKASATDRSDNVDNDTSDPLGLWSTKKAGGGVMGKGTKGRGKQSRGTMLWSSDTAEITPSIPEVPPVPSLGGGADLGRTDSRESAIYIGTEEPSTPTQEEPKFALNDDVEEEVPKDEIELLEEQGKLEVESDVSPLPPPPTSSGDSTAQPDDDGAAAAATGNVLSYTPDPSSESSTTEAALNPAETPSTSTLSKPMSAKPTYSTPSKSSTSPIRQLLSPSTETSPSTYATTAAASPLKPPRNLSRSPEARQKVLASSPRERMSIGVVPDQPVVGDEKNPGLGLDDGQGEAGKKEDKKAKVEGEEVESAERAEREEPLSVVKERQEAGLEVVVKKGEGKEGKKSVKADKEEKEDEKE